MYHIILLDHFDKTIVGWYDASASNFSTDHRRAKLFLDRVDADSVAYQLRHMYPRLAQDIEVIPAVQRQLSSGEVFAQVLPPMMFGSLTAILLLGLL